jgi:glutaredoxin
MKKVALCAAFLPAILAFSSQISAQQLYRIVGADGKVTFSDQPPSPSSNAKVTSGRGGSFAESAGGAALPFELRNVAQRFPVTIYTGKDCSPCDAGRNMLRTRGVPYTERTVESREDIESFKRISSDAQLPLATIGGQQLKGYSDSEWSQYLDAAGYPKTSQLPAGYRNPAPSPLVARAAPAPAAAPAAAPEPTPVQIPEPARSPNNPAGIRF